MKRLFLLLSLLILFIIICASEYVNAVSSDISENLFRLHVIANSDSEEDQNLKYLVRDNIIKYINGLSENLTSKDEVLRIAKENSEQIQKIAENTVQENGFNYPVNVEIGNFAFPTKQYGDISIPTGFYDATKVEIGNATGKNWWCVMFPPLCFVDVSSGIMQDSSKEIMQENLTMEEFKLISGDGIDTNIKFKIVEFFQDISMKLAKK